jgi:hypothetical protein
MTGSYKNTEFGNKTVEFGLSNWSHDGFYNPQQNIIKVAFDNVTIIPVSVEGTVSNVSKKGFDVALNPAVPGLIDSNFSLNNGETRNLCRDYR